jgi:NAD(P)-dependent dehydrogenase (short-subunit alcohol dehydrogenase family)
LLLAQRGWRCVLLDRDADRLAQLKIELETQESHRHLYRVVDLTRWDELQAVTQGLPELDAVINNAGMSTPGINALETLTQEPTSRLVGLNLLAPARLIQACQYAIKPHARIVNVASGAALRAIPARGLYSPSKAGLLEQTRALAQAFPHWTVTALSPGFVRTELVQQLLDGGQLQAEQALAKIPLGRLAEPWEIAHALLFLATQSPHLLSGQNLSLCGGSSIYGGSQRLTVTRAACVSPNTPSLIRFAAPLPTPWQSIQASLGQAQDSKSAGVYVGLIDASPLLAGEGQVLETVQNAAACCSHADFDSGRRMGPSRRSDQRDPHLGVGGTARVPTTAALHGRTQRPIPDRTNRQNGSQYRRGTHLTALPLDRESIKAEFQRERGYWRPWTETLLRERPQFLQTYAKYAGHL